MGKVRRIGYQVGYASWWEKAELKMFLSFVIFYIMVDRHKYGMVTVDHSAS